MLVIGRKPGEYVKIGDVFVRVVKQTNENGNSGLRLQIAAPREVEILRGEIYELNEGAKSPFDER